MSSIKDVAKLANVSVGTASRALRNVGYLSEETRNSVLNAAKELNYVANYSAQQIRMTDSIKTIGIIISETANNYFYKVIEQLKTKLLPHHFRVIVLFSSPESQEEEDNFRYLISSRVYAILFVPASSKQKNIISLAKKNNIRLIQLFVKAYHDLDTVINDDESGTAYATKFLIDNGCKNLLLLDAPYKNFDPRTVIPNRQHGFHQVVSGIEQHIVNYDPYSDTTLNTLKDILCQIRPDGVIAGIGKTGQNLTNLIHKHGFRFRFVTFDDNSWFECYEISAIRQQTALLVNNICDCILKQTDTPHCYRIPENLIVRKT